MIVEINRMREQLYELTKQDCSLQVKDELVAAYKHLTRAEKIATRVVKEKLTSNQTNPHKLKQNK